MPVFFSPTRIQDQLDFASVPGAGNDGYALTWDNASGTFVLAEMAGGGVTDHGALTGLADDDHGQYALLAGRATPQTLAFGSASGATAGYLTSTSHATKGSYALNAAGTMVVDEVLGRITLTTQYARIAVGLVNAIVIQESLGGAVIQRSGSAGFLFENTDIIPIWGTSIPSGDGYSYLGTNTNPFGGISCRGGFKSGVPTAQFLAGVATITPMVLRGAASQTAPLVQLQGLSSTSTVRERANIDAIAVDNTDATRKYALVLSPWDTAAREGMRLWADGSAGRVALSAPASAPTDAHLANGQWSSYLDESGHNLVIRAKYSDGTLKTATIALT